VYVEKLFFGFCFLIFCFNFQCKHMRVCDGLPNVVNLSKFLDSCKALESFYMSAFNYKLVNF